MTIPPSTNPIDALLDRLAAPDWPARVIATLALGASGQVQVRQALATALEQDEAWPVRASGAAGLGALKQAESFEALRAALADPAWPVAVCAALALEHAPRPEAAAALTRAQIAPHSGLRWAAARAQSALTGQTAPDARETLNDKDPFVAWASIWALALTRALQPQDLGRAMADPEPMLQEAGLIAFTVVGPQEPSA